ncbi:hypothetical protein AB0L63_19465 [Nocardia sp. NPDC051990]|uniref:hypothetical protein n=1 Tax=Nocardia sp. NPDC051990 TaxID=3155285 RepID=UPI0034235986
MPLDVFLIVLVGVAMTAVVIVDCRWVHPRRRQDGPRGADLRPWWDWDEASAGAVIWPFNLSHREPDEPFTVEQAHRAMQWHRQCRADSCPCKRTAFQALVAAGRVVPDLRADRYAR